MAKNGILAFKIYVILRPYGLHNYLHSFQGHHTLFLVGLKVNNDVAGHQKSYSTIERRSSESESECLSEWVRVGINKGD